MSKNAVEQNKWNQTNFELSNGYKFSIAHNLQYPDEINAAFDNWMVRTKVFTDKSFCDYINSKRSPEQPPPLPEPVKGNGRWWRRE